MSTVIDGSNSVTINSGAILGITSGTAVASTSGTSIDFTSIPSWVKRITVMFNGVSLSGTTNYLIQVGSGSVSTTGYISRGTYFIAATTTGQNSTTGFVIGNQAAANTNSGAVTLTLFSANTWVANGYMAENASNATSTGGITPALSGALDRVRITTVNGTDTFDAGSINILYE
jgi:hypothetical protein